MLRGENVMIRDMKYIYLSIIGIFISELMIFFGNAYYGLIIHAINILVLIYAIISSDSLRIRYALQGLMLVALLRIINLSIPQFSINPLLQYSLIYGIMFIPIFIFIKQMSTKDFKESYFSFKNVKYIPVGIILGIVMAVIEYYMQNPTVQNPLVSVLGRLENVNISDAISIGIVMFVFVVFVEEMIFRGILQTNLQKIFGLRKGLLFSGIIFGMMHSIYGILNEMIFAGIFGIMIGYIFQKTKNFPLIVLIHGSLNVILFNVLSVDMSTSVIATNSKEVANIGGELVTIILIISLLISLLLANTKYWKKSVPDTLNMYTKTLSIVFVIIMIFKVVAVVGN